MYLSETSIKIRHKSAGSTRTSRPVSPTSGCRNLPKNEKKYSYKRGQNFAETLTGRCEEQPLGRAAHRLEWHFRLRTRSICRPPALEVVRVFISLPLVIIIESECLESKFEPVDLF